MLKNTVNVAVFDQSYVVSAGAMGTHFSLQVEKRLSFLDIFLHSSSGSNGPFLGVASVMFKVVIFAKSQLQVSIFCIKTSEQKSVENVCLASARYSLGRLRGNRDQYCRLCLRETLVR